MDTLYSFINSLIDPVVIIVVLLAAGTLRGPDKKKKGVALFLVPTLVLLYGMSISPVANFLSHILETDFVRESPMPPGRLDVVVVLGGGSHGNGRNGGDPPVAGLGVATASRRAGIP